MEPLSLFLFLFLNSSGVDRTSTRIDPKGGDMGGRERVREREKERKTGTEREREGQSERGSEREREKADGRQLDDESRKGE